MRERPILFSGPLVRAILEGRKTQTRRVVKPVVSDILDAGGLPGHRLYPYGLAGDRLWVREAWSTSDEFDEDPPSRVPSDAPILYMADGSARSEDGLAAPWGRTRPSIFMRRPMSRIDLEVTGVRIERLQEITEEDAIAEGITSDPADLVPARLVFADLWRQINDKRPGCSWDANPWVWVVSFRVAEVRHG